ncbi:MAG: MinD/ParA family protein [Deltaproteobacteria bacterium]|nr:MinD/ParA family protein [Deltaproteobacteria bacterium]
MATEQKRESEIWAIGGGKGGIGKSFVISSIGTSLALREKRVVLIDADFGGANLHSFLGVSRPKFSLTDFFDKKLPLSDLIVNGGTKNLGFVAGAIDSLAGESFTYTQKLKLFRHIKRITADYVIIDLAAGSTFNTIDAFLLADKMVAVIIPELTSIENMYYFLKNAFFRRLIGSLNDNGFKDLVLSKWKNRWAYNITNLKQLVDYLKGLSNQIKDIVDKELSNFEVHIVLNMIRTNQHVSIGNSVKSVCSKFLGFNAHYAGYVEYDNSISRAVNRRQPYMLNYSASRCAKEIERVTDNLLSEDQIRIRLDR